MGSVAWRAAFVATFLTRDLGQLRVTVPAATVRRFWTMVAHCHGNRWNAAELGRSLGVSAPTVNRHLDALVDTLVVRRLTPWFENVRKRQVKAPKVYLADTGLIHSLLEIASDRELLGHPRCGASWERFAIHDAVRILDAAWDRCHYWATHTGAEIDLFTVRGGERIGVEAKRPVRPR